MAYEQSGLSTEIEIKTTSRKPEKIYIALSFALPFLIMGTLFALHGVYPFGGRQILVVDYWQQYYPFLSDYWHKLRGLNSMQWSWTAGAGTNYLAMIAYYLASPLNLFIALFPHAWLREVLVVILLLKLSLAGGSFALFLRSGAEKCGPSLPVFASFYALCAFTQGYYWNIMWFDTFALLPLAALGLGSLVKEGRYRLYIVSLALSVFVNYYIGLFTCIFTAITFFIHCAVEKTSPKLFLRRLSQVALCSVIALGLTAALTVPAYYALLNSYSAVNKFPRTLKLYESFADIAGNLIAFVPPTTTEGLPNLYGGMACVPLAAMFLSRRRIPLREKIAYAGLAVFLVVSCNLNVTNYIWHGMHVTNMLPYRFSFLFSFEMIYMAHRAYLTAAETDRRDLAVAGVASAAVVICALVGPQENAAAIGAAALCAVYLALFMLHTSRRPAMRAVAGTLFIAAALAELSVTAYQSVETVRTSDRDAYLNRYGQVQQLLDMREPAGPEFYRTEFTRWYSVNDPSLYGYDGVSLFSSTLNVSATRFMLGLGLPGGESANRYYYAETSPLTASFLNIRYHVNRAADAKNDSPFWEISGEADGGLLLKNKYHLPLGFMAEPELAGYARADQDPFASQNDLFRRATGLEGDLFTVIDMIHVGHKNYTVTRSSLGNYKYAAAEDTDGGTLKWNYEPPVSGTYYAYVNIDNAEKATVSVGGRTLRTVEIKRPYLFYAGYHEADKIFSIIAELGSEAEKGSALIYVGYLEEELFVRGHGLLSDETLRLDKFSDTGFSGAVTAKKDGLLYTSVPYEKGWTARVDGVKTEILPIDGSMAALHIEAGEHEIEFSYRAAGLNAGVIISAVSLAAFVYMIVKKRGFDDKTTCGQS